MSIATMEIVSSTPAHEKRRGDSPKCASPRALPRAFIDHNARQSVINLFSNWVRQADSTDNGVIVINRQRQLYSDTTVDKALRWLIKHRLIMRAEDGLGRGNGSRYFIRWSFAHPDLSTRQKAVNHSEPAKRVNQTTFRREAKDCSFKKTPAGVQPFAQSKSYRWAMSRARATIGELTSTSTSPSYGAQPGPFAVDLARDPGGSWTTSGDQQQRQRPQRRPETPYLQAFARTLKLAVERKAVRPGAQLGAFVKHFTQVLAWNFRFEADPHKAYSFIIGLGVDEIEIARRDRQEEAEARRHPWIEEVSGTSRCFHTRSCVAVRASRPPSSA